MKMEDVNTVLIKRS